MVRKAYNISTAAPQRRKGESRLTRKKGPGGGRQVATLKQTLAEMQAEYARTGVRPTYPTIPLPQLNPHAAPKVGQIVRGPVDANFTGTVVIGRAVPVAVAAAAGKAIARGSWRYRWNLTPFVATGAVAACATAAPTPTTVGLAAGAVAAHAAANHMPELIFRRKWLSVRERTMVSMWAGCAAAWSAGLGHWWQPNLLGYGLLTTAVAAPTVGWIRSRRIREDTGGLSKEAHQLVKAWPTAIAADPDGAPPLLGSRIVRGSMKEPRVGTYSFVVQLRGGVHAETATEPSVRRYLEAAMALGKNTALLEGERNDVTRIHVTLSPARHLEAVAADWTGPVLHKDGTIDLAVTNAGEIIRAALYNDAGVEHFVVTGTTGGGKSYTTGVLLLPGVMARDEVVFYVDGGQGSSAPHLTGAFDWPAYSQDDMRALIRSVHAVMRARKTRRALAGLGHWRGGQETDPVITLCIDEATTVKSMIGDNEQNLVHELLREGRKVGVRVGQITQDSMGDALIGGRGARDLMMGGGIAIGHRPGGKVASMLATNSSSESIDLTALPDGPGWAGIIRRNQVLARAARVLYASGPKVLTELSGFVPRELQGEDARAAGEAYLMRTRGHEVAARMRAIEAGAPIQDTLITTAHDSARDARAIPDDDARTVPDDARADDGHLTRALSGSQLAAQAMRAANCAAVMSVLLDKNGGPLTRGQIADITKIHTKTVGRALDDLHAEGRVQKADGRAWELVLETAGV